MSAPLEGLHHVTALTADAQVNLDFYVGFLGLRLIKRSINQGNPRGYHLFYGDEAARPGADITFFPYARLPRGRAGDGMVSRVVWRVDSVAAVDFWERRCADRGVAAARSTEGAIVLSDPDGLELELAVVAGLGDPPLKAVNPEVPAEHALAGLHAVRAYAAVGGGGARGTGVGAGAGAGATGLDGLLGVGPGGAIGSAFYLPEAAPALRGRRGAGTVHHVAWAIPDAAYEGWVARLTAAGVELVEVVDRYYFRSIYFHLPVGVLFELATLGPGFLVDEPLATLGTRLSIPPAFAARRAEIEAALPPLVDPRAGWSSRGAS